MKKQEDREYFLNLVRGSENKKKCVEEYLSELIDEMKFFTNDDFGLDGYSYGSWNSYEVGLISKFIKSNTFRYSLGYLIDLGLFASSKFKRKKFVYSKYSIDELLSIKAAEERQKTILEILR